MELLERKIETCGTVLDGNVLKVDSFLNHLIDVPFLSKLADYVYEQFKDEKVNKILTVEASGIALATLVAERLSCDMTYAKKSRTSNLGDEGVYSASVRSFTHNVTNNIIVNKKYLSSSDRVLVVDDFLARGEAANGMISIVEQAGATLVAMVAAIEKGFQGGGDALRKKGINVLSLAIIDKMSPDGLIFRKQ